VGGRRKKTTGAERGNAKSNNGQGKTNKGEKSVAFIWRRKIRKKKNKEKEKQKETKITESRDDG
jgi:hypothetical protein